MSASCDRKPTLNKRLPAGLGWLAALACLACCAVPLFIGAGVLTGAAWSGIASGLPAVAVALVVLAVAAWWIVQRRNHARGCSTECSCAPVAAERPI